jgi:uncharacterized repeat protein (TIGR01451 family)
MAKLKSFQLLLISCVALFVMVFAVLGSGRASAQQNLPSEYQRLLDKVRAQGRISVIVELDIGSPFVPEGNLAASGNVPGQRAAIDRAQAALLAEVSSFAADVYARFNAIPHMAFEVDEAALQVLFRSALVAHIEEDVAVPATLASSTAVIGAPYVWAAGYDGSGQTVVILDTGIDAGHSFFGGRVVDEACFSNLIGTGSDTSLCPAGGGVEFGSGAADATIAACNGGSLCDHGTHVAGIAAGNGVTFDGVARNADIIAIQVFTRFNSGCQGPPPCIASWTTDQLAALNYIYNTLRLSHTIAAVNMSLGGSTAQTSTCDSDSRKTTIDNLVSVGIATIIASGNDGYVNATGAPGCISTAITVGATEDDDDVATFSNIAPFIDLLAPGVAIDSSVPGGGFGSKQGTSMATPMVAGAWAVFKEISPTATVASALSVLQSTATLVDDNRTGGIETNMPRISLDGAMNTVRPGLGVDKTAALFVFAGQTLTYTIDVSNTTSVTATNVIITDVVPANTTLNSSSLSGDAAFAGTSPGNLITWTTSISLNPNQSLQRAFSVDVDSGLTGGVISNQAYATGTGMTESRSSPLVQTTVTAKASCGFFDSFETGTLSEYWRTHTTNEGRVRVAGQITTVTMPQLVFTPHTGSYQVVLDDSVAGSLFSEAGILLTLDMTGQTDITLDFWWAESLDEDHPEDGVFISDDFGMTWHEALSFNGGSSTYTNSIIDIVAEAAASSLTLNDHFQIMFRFYDNWYLSGGDGYVIDDVQILCGDLVWDGGGSTRDWSEAANWMPDTVPNGNNVTFNGTSTKDALVDGAFGGIVGDMLVSSAYSGTITQTANLSIQGNLSQTNGVIDVSDTLPLQVSGVISHTGGALKQTKVVNGQAVEYLKITDDSNNVKYRGVDIDTTTSGNDLGSVTVAVKAIDFSTEFCTITGASSPAYARRCYTITPQNNLSATVTLWALDTERNGIAEVDLIPYRFVPGAGWQLLSGTPGNDGGSYVFGQAVTPGFSSFLLGNLLGGNVPTAVSLLSISGTAAREGPAKTLVLTGLLALLLSILLAWRARRIRRRTEAA